ncbi:MAG TPA: hypothetical protein VMI53_10065 [Opitutaceae bacterium]|nr:hypothetical protein [Opitutaceae bacterium]
MGPIAACLFALLLAGARLIAADPPPAQPEILPGSEGAGVADVLWGRYAPTRKLPVSWPRAMTQVPINMGDSH